MKIMPPKSSSSWGFWTNFYRGLCFDQKPIRIHRGQAVIESTTTNQKLKIPVSHHSQAMNTNEETPISCLNEARRTSSDIIRKYPNKIRSLTNKMIQARIQQKSLIKANLNKVSVCFAAIRKVLETHKRTIVSVGSFVNGMATPNSDLDLVLLPYKTDEELSMFRKKFSESHAYRSFYMKAVTSLLESKKIVKRGSVCQVEFTSVPIIKFATHEGIEVDIQFLNIEPIRSSLYLRTCVQHDERVSILISWLNGLFSSLGLKNSQKGLFSTYHINMLVIHFLQTYQPVVIPQLVHIYPLLNPDAKWSAVAECLMNQNSLLESWTQNRDTVAVNQDTVGSLAISLINYYASLNLDEFGIDVTGMTFKRSRGDEENLIIMRDIYHQRNTNCLVRNGPYIINNTFQDLQNRLIAGNFESLLV